MGSGLPSKRPEPMSDTERLLLHNGSILTSSGAAESAMTVSGGRIDGFGGSPDDHDGPLLDLAGGVVRPGYIDLHCHGGGGATVYSGNEDDVATVARTHLAHGTTTMLASLTAAPSPVLRAAAEVIARAVASGRAPNIAGIHYEGPFLSPQRPGAQPIGSLRAVDAREIADLIEAAGGLPVSMTIAPELPGAVDAIARFKDDVVFFVGHTDATSAEFDAAVDAGARAVTHLFNAMPPLHHRDPGPVARALLDPRIRSEIILDGHHLDDDTVRLALACAGPGRLLLVTDAMAAAGMVDGAYSLPGLDVTVEEAAAYVTGTRTLAGSTLTMDRAVARLRGVGVTSEPDVVGLASGTAAELMGWHDRGSLRVGARADLVVTERAGSLASVFLAGERVRPDLP